MDYGLGIKKQLDVVSGVATGSIIWVHTSVYNCFSTAVHAGTQLRIVHQSPNLVMHFGVLLILFPTKQNIPGVRYLTMVLCILIL